jgi:hypothetical protein
VSFIIWIVGSAFAAGGGVAPGITYGIYTGISGNTTGVTYLWINSPANGGALSSPKFPTVMLDILNELIVIISLAVAIFTGIEFMVSLFSYYAERH